MQLTARMVLRSLACVFVFIAMSTAQAGFFSDWFGGGESEAALKAHLDQAYSDADALYRQGQLAPAVAILDKVYGKRAYRSRQPEIFNRILLYYLMTNDVASAQARLWMAWKRHPPVAEKNFGIFENHLLAQGNYDQLEQWCDKLNREKSIPESMVAALGDYRFRAMRASGQKTDGVAIMKLFGARLSPNPWKAMATALGRQLIEARDFPAADRFLEYLDTQMGSIADLKPLRISLQVMRYTAERRWNEAVSYFKSHALDLPDASLSQLFAQFVDFLRRMGQAEESDALCRDLIYRVDMHNHPQTREAAAHIYVSTPLVAEQVSPALQRIDELYHSKAGFSGTTVGKWLDALYPLAMQRGSQDDFRHMLILSQSLLNGMGAAAITDEKVKGDLAGLLLDVAFRVEDFDAAYAQIQKGVPGQGKAWHESMLIKVQAHRALKEGDKDAAVKYFKIFLETVVPTIEPLADPIAGDMVTREVIGGLNAKRIADLLTALNRPKEASDYYAKARLYYQQALKQYDSKSSRYRSLEADMAEMALK